jgi:small subunit ribosomal protein S20
VPNHKSAEKRVHQREKRRLRNRLVMGRMRSALKRARTAIEQKSPEAQKLLQEAVVVIDKAVSKGVVRRNTGSRYISRLFHSSQRAQQAPSAPSA